MTSTLKLSAAALAALLALAGAARADGVKITYSGKSPAAVRTQVVQAAHTVCSEAVATDIRGEYGSFDECVSATVDATLSDMRQRSATIAMVQTAQR